MKIFFPLAVLVLTTLFGLTSSKAAEESKLPTKSFLLSKGEVRMSYIYRAPGNQNQTNLLYTTWEKRIEGKWTLHSRDFYVGGQRILSEHDFDQNGAPTKLFLRYREQLIGLTKEGAEITGLVPQAELDEIIEIEKSAGEVGSLIGSHSAKTKENTNKTGEQILKELADKFENQKPKQPEPPK